MTRRVADLMTRAVEQIVPEMTVREAATLMRERNIGCFPVCDGGRVVGILTDRDIAVRVLAVGRDPDATRVDEAMSREVVCCGDDDYLTEASDLMSRWQIRRIPVVSRRGDLVGLLTLGKLAATDASVSGNVLKQVVQPTERQS